VRLLTLVAAALLAQGAAPPTDPPAERQPSVHVEAGEAAWDLPAGEARFRGGFLLRRGGLSLTAPEGRYWPDSRRVELTGGALLVEGARAVLAKSLRGELGGRWEAENPSVLFVRDPAALAGARTPEDAARLADRRLTLRAEQAVGGADGGILLTGARGTLCSCPDDRAPTWEVRARSADVRPGERAILSWPVLWITPRILSYERPFPILALPWLWVPLGDRQSGLLLPEVRSTGSSGTILSLPLFLTLGRSADATAWAGWAFGRPGAEVRAGKPSVRGLDAALELRWRPAEESAGRVKLDWSWDLDAEPGGTHGARVAITGVHAQRLGARAFLRAELDLAGDPLYVRDYASDLLQRDASYRRSAFLAVRGGDHLALEASGAWLLPLARDGALAGVDGLSFGIFGSGLPTFHRGPALAAILLPAPLWGGLLGAGRAELARFGPLDGATSDAGADGLGPGDRGWNPVLADAGQLDGRWNPGERLAATRASLRAEVSHPLAVARLLRVTPFLLGAASAFVFDAVADPAVTAWGAGGATVESELSRRFGTLRHAVVPRLAWRIGSGVAGEALPAFGYDGWDRAAEVPPLAAGTFDAPRLLAAAPPGSFHQGRASLETRLDGPGGELLRLEAGQDFDLRAGRLAESFATLRVGAGPLRAEGVLRYAGFAARPAPTTPSALRLGDWTEVAGTLRFRTQRGYDLHAAVRQVGAGGSPSVQGGADALFDLRPTPLPASAQASAGARLPIGSATLGYDLLITPRAVTVPGCDAVGTRRLGALHAQQQTATFVWDSPCHCLRLSARVRVNDCGDVAFSAGVDLSPGEPVGALK
jgi:LPS-assembly protein